jgi:DUF4097 and DUF4098 domain-containing protein YvlB
LAGIRNQFALSLLMLGLALAGVAQTEGASKIYRDGSCWVEETTGTLPASRIVKIHTNAGSVSVTGGSQSNITYIIRKRVSASSEESARRLFENLRVIAGRQGEAAYFGGEGGGWHRGSVEFNINTPRNVDVVKAKTDGGNLQFSHLNGRLDAESGGGTVNLDDISGNITASTGGGGINVGNVNADVGIRTGGGHVNIGTVGGKLNASTGGESVHVENVKHDAIIDTGGGNISVQNVGGDLRASTGGGNIEIGSVNGRMEVETGGGSIRLTGGGGGPIRAQTGSGSIQCWKASNGVRAETGAGSITAEFLATNGKFTDSTLETGVGDIIVYIPSDLKVSVHASIDVATARDAIRSELPGIRILSEGGGEYGPREMAAEGNLNGGGPMLKLHTSTGKIQLMALKK